jgi:hypothetical protein
MALGQYTLIHCSKVTGGRNMVNGQMPILISQSLCPNGHASEGIP